MPTYRERDNLPQLIERVAKVRDGQSPAWELLIVDDNSRDGSEEFVRLLGLSWVRFILRTTDRGLSPSVLDGLRHAGGDLVVVMDADLSHPPERIPDLLRAINDGAEFVIGSRYVAGGSTDAAWGVFRWLNSKIATLLARPFTRARDPMSGFFALRRAALAHAAYLNPIGYKIGLELIVKCGFTRIAEVPIHFADRSAGESKLSFKEQLRYIQHLRRLFIFKYGTWSHAAQFAVVGLSGTVVNLGVLTLLIAAGMATALAAALAIAVSMVTNFLLNRRFSFSYARGGSIFRQFLAFVATCSAGAVANYATTILVLGAMAQPVRFPQIAAVVGIAVGMVFNFVFSRYFVFRPAAARLSEEDAAP